MIGMLHGTVVLKKLSAIIIDVHGVGYKVFVPSNILSAYTLGDEVKVFTYTHVRDDALELYGFTSGEDLTLFEMLISVSGVGCKSALGVFSVGDRGNIIHAVVTGDVGFFTAVPRLGKKNGQKIIIELKNKLGGIEDLDLSSGGNTEAHEAIVALQSFGFSHQEAELAVSSVKGENVKTEDLIRQALKKLGR